jgi:hypothetical protein
MDFKIPKSKDVLNQSIMEKEFNLTQTMIKKQQVISFVKQLELDNVIPIDELKPILKILKSLESEY